MKIMHVGEIEVPAVSLERLVYHPSITTERILYIPTLLSLESLPRILEQATYEHRLQISTAVAVEPGEGQQNLTMVATWETKMFFLHMKCWGALQSTLISKCMAGWSGWEHWEVLESKTLKTQLRIPPIHRLRQSNGR